MLKSMTGYGQAMLDSDDISLSVEIKSLNSKFLDSIIKLPREFSDKEIEIKNIVTETLIRGKINVIITFQRKNIDAIKMNVNEQLFNEYFESFAKLASGKNTPDQEVFKLAIQMPEVLAQNDDTEDLSSSWEMILENIHLAVKQCDEFRLKEGEILGEKLLNYIENIRAFLKEVESLDPQRMVQLRERLNQKIQELERVEKLDENRFEQELIYYIEKLDINEEKVRLKSHLDYFIEVLNSEESQGKKLGFICQEIGREINTIGSKANDAIMQRHVVGMKEELEKIKEQILNIL